MPGCMEEMDKLSNHSHASCNVERSRHRRDTLSTRLGMAINEWHSLKFRIVVKSGHVSVVGPLHVKNRVEISPSEYASDIVS
jgi:hypothetical protein